MRDCEDAAYAMAGVRVKGHAHRGQERQLDP